MFNFEVYEWQILEGALGWRRFDHVRRTARCHGAAAANFFGSSNSWHHIAQHEENSANARVYLYGGNRKFKFVKES